MRTKCAIAALFLYFGPLYPATWAGGTTGNTNTWDLAGNWTSPASFPNGTDATAIFNDTAYNSPNFANTGITLGTLTFSSTDTYTISNSMATYKLTFNASSANAVITMDSSGTLTIAPDIVLSKPLSITQNSTGDLNLTGTITGGSTQTLTVTGSGNVKLSSTSNSYSGGTTITSGTLIAEGNVLGTGTVTIANGTLEFDNANGASYTSSLPYTLNGTGTLEITSGTTVTLSGAISGSGSLQKTGAGTLILSNTSNSYSGGTTVSAGELRVSSDANLGNTSGSLNFAGGTFKTISANFTSARSGDISSNSNIFNTSGLSDTLSGNFSGSGSLTITGGGTLRLTGTNSYTGGTTVTGTSLIGTTNSLTGTISADGTSSLTFSQNFNGTFGGSLQGAAPLVITGGGAVTLSGTHSLSGATSVQQGALLVTGSLASSSITVSSGATLGGTGTVGTTTLQAGGTLDPGAGTTLGTLSVQGNLTLNASSIVNIDLSPVGTDLIAVGGTATLTGSRLVVSPNSGFYAPFSTYTVLTTTNPLVTTFGSTESDNSNFSILNVSYGTHSVALTVQALSPFFGFPFSNQNTRAVGENINALSAANAIPPALLTVINTFVGQSNSAINTALDQMHPAPYSAYTELQEELGAQIVSLFHRKPTLECGSCLCQPSRIWLKPFGNSLTEKRHGEQFGFTANSGGLALGIDHEVLDDWILGIGGAWNNTHLEWHNHYGKGKVNGFYGAFYTDYQIWNFYFGGSVLAGVDFTDTTRHIQFFSIDKQAQSSYRSLDVIGQLTSAYYFGAPNALLYPYANFDFLYLQTPHFTEHGAPGLNLSVASRASSTFRTEMGIAFQVQDTNYAETLCITPLFSLGWVNMFPIERPSFQANFENATIPFTTFGWEETWNLFALSFNLYIDYDCFKFGLEYKGEMSADKETLLYNHNGDVRFDWRW